jgi:transposase
MNTNDVVPLRTAAKMIGVTLNTVRKWVVKGMPTTRAVPATPRECGAVLVRVSDLIEWSKVDRRTTESGGHQRRAAAERIETHVPRLLVAIESGKSLHDACIEIGIHPNTAKRWVRICAPGAAPLVEARSRQREADRARLRADMERVLTRYASGTPMSESCTADGFSRYQAHNWRTLATEPDLSEWFDAEVTRETAKRKLAPRTARQPKRGRVYFLQGVDGGCIKIGFTSRDTRERLADLQTGSPVLLRILHVVPGSKADESAAHARFAASHSHGEWFRPTADLLSFISAACTDLDTMTPPRQLRLLA